MFIRFRARQKWRQRRGKLGQGFARFNFGCGNCAPTYEKTAIHVQLCFVYSLAATYLTFSLLFL